MTDQRPHPFTTPEMDIRDLDGFMLNVERMMASELFALATGDEFKAAFALWCRAWKQVPAGSLPNNESVLASFSGAAGKWRKVREMALHGFTECSDGRLYHKVLCEDVYRAWSNKQEYLEGKSGDAERKKREREERSRMFADLRAAGVTPEWNVPTRALRALVTRHVTPVTVTCHTAVTPPVTVTVTANTGQDRTGQDKKEKSSLRSDSSDHGSDVRPESAASQSPEKPARPKKSRDDFGPEFAAWYQKYPRHEARGDAEKAYRASRKSGAAADELLAGAERYADSRRGENPQYTKLPATWIRSKCWLDEPPDASQTADEKPLSPAELAATRREYLRSWAAGKPWIQNISGNGIWRDQYGIGPPPDDPRTLVTADDLAAVPDAARRVNQPRRIPAE